MGRKPKNPLHWLGKLANDQLRRAAELGGSLDKRTKEKVKAVGEDQGWIPDEDWRRDFASVTAALQHAGNSLIRAQEGNKKNLGTLTEAQLEAQLHAEIQRAAKSMPEEQWQAMVAARNRSNQ